MSDSTIRDKSLHPELWEHLQRQLSERERTGLLRGRVVTRPVGPTQIERAGQLLTHFGSNDYLSLSWHPQVLEAGLRADATDFGGRNYGSGASPLITGYTSAHEELAAALARFEATESAILFSSGYATNVGTVSALSGEDDVLYSDELNHASLIDGCRLSRARVYIYCHNDIDHLRELVNSTRSQHQLAFVVTDSLFSMDGDVANLAAIDALCAQHQMNAIVDEAHATGVYGANGRGCAESQSIESERLIRTCTLSKAIGCVGGFVSGQQVLCDWLANFARSWIYSTAATLPSMRAAFASIQLLQTMREERETLARKSRSLRQRLRELGFETLDGDSPIVPIYVGTPEAVMHLSQSLVEAGLYVPAIRPPTVPANRSMLRVSLTISHSESDLERLLRALSACRLGRTSA